MRSTTRNGQLQERTNYKDGELDGLWEYFYENGELKTKRTFKLISGRVKVHGLYEEYHENGQLQERTNYKDGELDGLWEYFYENGELKTKRTFKLISGRVKVHGLYEEYHENGQLQERTNYKDGELDGLWEYFLRKRGIKV